MAIEIAAVLGTLKSVANAAKEAGKIDLYNQVIDLQQAVLEAIGENTRLTVDNADLTRKVIALENALTTANDAARKMDALKFADGAYWLVENDQSKDGPFCPKCLDADGKRIRMADRHNGFNCCVNCSYCIRNSQYREE